MEYVTHFSLEMETTTKEDCIDDITDSCVDMVHYTLQKQGNKVVYDQVWKWKL